MRKLETKELLHFSELINELKRLHQEIIAEDKEVDPYTFIWISDNLEQAISNYRMELSVLHHCVHS